MTRVPNAQLSGGATPGRSWQFCAYCGEKITGDGQNCPKCGASVAGGSVPRALSKSPKSYGIAVALCGIFGMVGIHHFYIGQWVHGFIDLGMFVGWIALGIMFGLTGEAGYGLSAGVLFCVDGLHTLYVFYLLIIGQQKDGQGRLVTFDTK